jgi:hypothetical protein
MMSETDDDLLQVDDHHWPRRKPSIGFRLLCLVLVLVAIASAIYRAL